MCICLVDFAHDSDWLGISASIVLSVDATTKPPLYTSSRRCSRWE